MQELKGNIKIIKAKEARFTFAMISVQIAQSIHINVFSRKEKRYILVISTI
jgi:hypothetical protein